MLAALLAPTGCQLHFPRCLDPQLEHLTIGSGFGEADSFLFLTEPSALRSLRRLRLMDLSLPLLGLVHTILSLPENGLRDCLRPGRLFPGERAPSLPWGRAS